VQYNEEIKKAVKMAVDYQLKEKVKPELDQLSMFLDEYLPTLVNKSKDKQNVVLFYQEVGKVTKEVLDKAQPLIQQLAKPMMDMVIEVTIKEAQEWVNQRIMDAVLKQKPE
jgi:phage tail tape-measure protein